MSFNRTELRTMQNACAGDNEKFLDMVANLINNQDRKIDELNIKVYHLEEDNATMEREMQKIISNSYQ